MFVSIEQKIFSRVSRVFYGCFLFLSYFVVRLFPHLVSSPPSSFDFTRTTPKTDLNLKKIREMKHGTKSSVRFWSFFWENFLGNQKKIFTEKDLSQMFNCQTFNRWISNQYPSDHHHYRLQNEETKDRQTEREKIIPGL